MPGSQGSAAATTRWTRRQWAALLVTCLGQFVTQLDLTVVNVATGGIRADFGASITVLTWVIDAYLVTFAAFMLGLGDLADLLGRRRVFLAGLALFAVCSAGCAAAPGAAWLVAARAAQGVAGAAVLVCSLALLVHGFEGAQRNRAIGWWASVAGTALVIGPVVGGEIVDTLGWRWVFWINVPVCLTGLAAGVRVLAESRGGGRPIDWPGQLLAACGLGALAFGLQVLATNAGLGWAALAAAAALVGGFVIAERQTAAPLVPLRLLGSRSFSGANSAALLLNLGTLGLLFLLSLYFEQVARDGAAGAGLRIAPLFAAYILMSPWAGRVHRRWGAVWPAGVGALAAGVGALVLFGLLRQPGWAPIALIVSGAGTGLALPAIVSVAVAAVPAERSGLASGLNNMARQVGNTLGVALLGGVVAGADSVNSGVRTGLFIVGACYIAAAVVVVSTLRPSPRLVQVAIRLTTGRTVR
jgi:MFS transporter, DHA2 family, methylenomycin A resistance protein